MSLAPQFAADLAQALDNALAIDNEVRELIDDTPTHSNLLAVALLKARLAELALDEALALINAMQVTAADIHERALSGKIRQTGRPFSRR